MAEPRRPASRGGPKGGPPLPPPGHQSSPLFHPPRGRAREAWERRRFRRSRAVWCWPTAKIFVRVIPVQNARPGASAPSTSSSWRPWASYWAARLVPLHLMCSSSSSAAMNSSTSHRPAAARTSRRERVQPAILARAAGTCARAHGTRIGPAQHRTPQRGKVPPHPLRVPPTQKGDCVHALGQRPHRRESGARPHR